MTMAKRKSKPHAPQVLMRWPDWKALEPFTDLRYEPVYLAEVHQAARRVLRALVNVTNAEDLLEAIAPVEELLTDYAQARSLAEICFQINREDPYFTAERLRYRRERKPLNELLISVYTNFIGDDDLLIGMVEKTGKIPLLDAYNQAAIHLDEVADAQDEEDAILAEIQSLGDFVAEIEGVPAGHQRIQEVSVSLELERLMRRLLPLRRQIALSQGFPSFVELGYRRLSYFDFDPEKARALHRQIEKYFVPVAAELRRLFYEQDGTQEDLTALYRQDLFMATTPRPEPPTLKWEKGETALRNTIAELSGVLCASLPSDTPDYFLELYDRGYVRIYERPGDIQRVKCYHLSRTGVPAFFANTPPTGRSLRSYLNVAGRMYGYFLPHREHSRTMSREPGMAALRIWGKCMEFLAYPSLDPLFEDADQASAWRAWHMASQILKLPILALLDEFQMHIHQVVDQPEEWDQFWFRLLRRYFPDLAHDENWLYRQRGGWKCMLSNYTEPFSPLSKIVAILVGMDIWDRSKRDRDGAIRAFQAFCQGVQDDTTLRLLDDSSLRDPFAADTIKRLIYQACDFLEL